MVSSTTDHNYIMASAYLTAMYRALESERDDALFHDPLARLLAENEGQEIVSSHPVLPSEVWAIAVRTHVFDCVIRAVLAEEEVDVVLNLAAGLDTRPYRLDLPADLRWIEVDFPEVLEYKQRMLQEHTPHCQLESLGLDLLDEPARQSMLSRVASESRQRVLVITEGLLSYLHPEQVGAVLTDLAEHPPYFWLLTEFLPAHDLPKPPRTMDMEAQNSPVQFAPLEGVRFFERYGWQEVEFYGILQEARRLKRDVRLGWLLRSLEWLNRVTATDADDHHESGGFVLLERIVLADDEETEVTS